MFHLRFSTVQDGTELRHYSFPHAISTERRKLQKEIYTYIVLYTVDPQCNTQMYPKYWNANIHSTAAMRSTVFKETNN